MERVNDVISHWHAFFGDFNTSGSDFYRLVEAKLRLQAIPDLHFSVVSFKEGGIASANRLYLRIEHEFVAFDICAAPYGTGFFFSWWLTRLGPKHPFLYLLASVFLIGAICRTLLFFSGGILSFWGWFILPPIVILILGYLVKERVIDQEQQILMVPILGYAYERLFSPVTYYRLDTAIMFQEVVRTAVLEIIDQLTTAKGLRALSEGERNPVLGDLPQGLLSLHH